MFVPDNNPERANGIVVQDGGVPTQLIWDGDKIFMCCGEDRRVGYRMKKIVGAQDYGKIIVFSYTDQCEIARLPLQQ